MLHALDLTLRGGAIALIAFVVIAMPRTVAARQLGWIAVAFGCGVAAYLMCSSPVAGAMPWVLLLLLGIGCLANPWLLWLFARAIFSDGFHLRWRHAWATVAILAVGMPAYLHHSGIVEMRAHERLVEASWIGFKFLSVTLALLALLEAWRGREADLVERRRVLRIYFVTIGAGYMLLVLVTEIFLQGNTAPAWLSLLNAAGILVVVAIMARRLLAPRFDLLLEPITQQSQPSIQDRTDNVLLERLQAAIQAKVHHEEGLTIARLAGKLQTQEHRLRPLINERLGFRNFNDFLHRHRVADACEALADPAKARIPVLTIALEVGYGSIGPFNRAFRELTGDTPTAYRRLKLGGRSAALREDDIGA